MQYKRILRIFSSMPIILVALYFSKILGIALLILRKFVHTEKRRFTTSITLVFSGILILLPPELQFGFDIFNLNYSLIPYFDNIINSDIYIKLLEYSKFILILGIILSILSLIFSTLFNRLISSIKGYAIEKEKVNREISKQNDLEIKIKREEARNTHVVTCKSCGADNVITSSVGKCKYCRHPISKK